MKCNEVLVDFADSAEKFFEEIRRVLTFLNGFLVTGA